MTGFNYEILFRPTQAHGNADALSRLPLQTSRPTSEISAFDIYQIAALPVTDKQIARRDPILSKVLLYTKEGWPDAAILSLEFQPYKTRTSKLTVEQDCLLWGIRVIIPPKLVQKILTELHESHSGMVHMKAVARSCVAAWD